MQKKIFSLGKFYFFKKVIFRPAFGHGRLGHPQSLEYSLSDWSLVHFDSFAGLQNQTIDTLGAELLNWKVEKVGRLY